MSWMLCGEWLRRCKNAVAGFIIDTATARVKPPDYVSQMDGRMSWFAGNGVDNPCLNGIQWAIAGCTAQLTVTSRGSACQFMYPAPELAPVR